MKPLYLVDHKVKTFDYSLTDDHNNCELHFTDGTSALQRDCFYLESNIYTIGDQFKFCTDEFLGKSDIFWVLGVNVVTQFDIPKWQYFLINSSKVTIWMYEDQINEFNIED